MWKKVDEVFSATTLNPINTKMNDIAGELVSATFSINTFANELENFVRDQLKNLEWLDNLQDSAANVKDLNDKFKSGAQDLLARSTTVSVGDGVRALLPDN